MGMNDVIKAIESRVIGNDFYGSPLEDVLATICEQKQVFEGAAHAFYWKSKLSPIEYPTVRKIFMTYDLENKKAQVSGFL